MGTGVSLLLSSPDEN